MANQALLDRHLSQEERDWVRALRDQPGFHLLVQAVGELMAQDLQTLLSSKDSQELFQAQGRYNRGKAVLELPKMLLDVPQSSIRERGPTP